jgi:hypothetical protein
MMSKLENMFFKILLLILSISLNAGDKTSASFSLSKLRSIQTSNADTGKVLFSNGEEWIGVLSMTKNRKLKINTATGMQMLPFNTIREIKLIPEKQEMEQKWFFPEAGKTRKEKSGDPYPIQHLKAEIILKNGKKISGHLFSSVLYLRPTVGKKKRIVLLSKQRGKERETLDDLVYPEQIVVGSSIETGQTNTRLLELPKKFRNNDYEIAAVEIPDLMDVKVRKVKEGFIVNGEFPEGLFTAVKKGNKITIFWPGGSNPELFKNVKNSIKEMTDFFDHRELKAVFQPAKGKIVFSLTLMIREKKTSLHAEKSNPWRLIVQRWKYDKNTGKLLLSGKGWLFRGIDKRGNKGPQVVISGEKCDIIKE